MGYLLCLFIGCLGGYIVAMLTYFADDDDDFDTYLYDAERKDDFFN